MPGCELLISVGDKQDSKKSNKKKGQKWARSIDWNIHNMKSVIPRSAGGANSAPSMAWDECFFGGYHSTALQW
ncbi:hypothetical protein ACNR90_001997 [Candidozyma auris]